MYWACYWAKGWSEPCWHMACTVQHQAGHVARQMRLPWNVMTIGTFEIKRPEPKKAWEEHAAANKRGAAAQHLQVASCASFPGPLGRLMLPSNSPSRSSALCMNSPSACCL